MHMVYNTRFKWLCYRIKITVICGYTCYSYDPKILLILLSRDICLKIR